MTTDIPQPAVRSSDRGTATRAALLGAAHLAAVRPGRVGRLLAVGLLLATLVVLGVPTWGSDVGGVLALTPAALVFGLVLWGRRIRLRSLVLAGAAGALAHVLG